MSRTARRRSRRAARFLLALGCAAGCVPVEIDVSGLGQTASEGASTGAPIVAPTGSTVVVVVNPIVNSMSKVDAPIELGDARDGVEVAVEPGSGAVTEDGLAVVDGAAGSLIVHVGPAALELPAVADGDLIDAPIAFDGSAAAYFAGTPIHYPVGDASSVTTFMPGAASEALAAALAVDGARVVLRAGVYPGDLEIHGQDVVLFGEGWAEQAVTLDGSLRVSGEGVHVRGVTIAGELDASGDDFRASFTRVRKAARISGTGSVLLRDTFCGNVMVPANDAILLHNFGVAPLGTPPAGACA